MTISQGLPTIDLTPRYVPNKKLGVNYLYNDFVSLGKPNLQSTTNIGTGFAANAAAGTVVNYANKTADANYGRAVIITCSGSPGAAGAVKLWGYGFDNQLITETVNYANLTAASGGLFLFTKKAFSQIFRAEVVTPSTNAITLSFGWSRFLGLPIKHAAIDRALENGAVVNPVTGLQTIGTRIESAAAAAGGSHYFIAPCAGYIETLRTVANGGGSTNDPVVTVELVNIATTGLTTTVDVSTAGSIATDVPTTTGLRPNNYFNRGDLIEVVHTAAVGATSFLVELDIRSIECVEADETDPATATTGDPRGLYYPTTTLDGAKEILVLINPNDRANSSGNGGLDGIKAFGA